MNIAQKIAAIEQVVSTLKPAIEGHGGSIEFVELKDSIVYVKLSGACIGCPSSYFTMKMGVEEAIQAVLPEVTEVVAIE